jgi:hypothetical protein
MVALTWVTLLQCEDTVIDWHQTSVDTLWVMNFAFDHKMFFCVKPSFKIVDRDSVVNAATLRAV